MPRLSVVVGTLDRLDQLQRCVESILAETRTPVRVYVSDAGSTDGTVDYLRSVASDRVRPIFAGRRQGQARAYNDVFAVVDTPYVCWLSDDNVVVNRGLDVAVTILDAEPRIGMVALKVKDLVGPFADAPYIGGISPIGILNVNQGVVRTAVLHDVGGFSEAFRDYGIDPDLTAKVVFSGHAVAYTRAIAIHHYRNWGDRGSVEFARQMARQRTYLDLYTRKYAGLARGSLTWMFKRAAASGLGMVLAAWPRLRTSSSFLGVVPRDWMNIVGSRYISVLDGVRSRGRPYHLVQWCPPRDRPPALPADEELERV
jgi:GT2 family glycosyltransferase